MSEMQGDAVDVHNHTVYCAGILAKG